MTIEEYIEGMINDDTIKVSNGNFGPRTVKELMRSAYSLGVINTKRNQAKPKKS
jgi:hypothetical protein